MNDDIFDYYESLIMEPTEQNIEDWVLSLRQSRGNKVINNKCLDCNINYMDDHQGTRVCPECGITLHSAITSTYNRKATPYKRMTHFKDWLIKTQAKHNPMIADEVLEHCRKHLNSIPTYKNIRLILKNAKLNKHYEDIWYIITYINPDAEVFKISNEEENRLCNLFIVIQETWNLIKPYTRKSIISYPFIITKLLDIIKRPELKKFFVLPRPSKVLYYEKLWKRIVNLTPLLSQRTE